MRGPVTPIHRGPQAATIPASVSLPFHAPNAALLIDFDNVTMGIRSDLNAELRNLLSSDIVKGKVSVQRAYADWRRYPQYIVPLTESSIDLIFAPAYGSSKKNATDIRLAIDALELVFTRPEIGTFILLSGDSDFSSLVLKLKEYGKYVIGVGIRESSSDLLVQNCDEYYSYNALAGLINTRDEEVKKWDPWELATEAVQRMKRNGDVMRADRLKQVMQQIDSSFDEKNLGMSKFSRFVTEAEKRGLVSLTKMENGQYEVGLPSDKELTDATPASAEPVAEVPAGDGEERRPRRGRGRGRGRDREGRPPRRAHDEADSVSADVAAEVPVTAEPEVVTPPRAEAQSATVADTIGLGGMRLTRDEAFELVRRAVAAVANNRPAKASAVRAAARDLLGRDSESLSERNFTRILKDAHDGDVIDLRRRGNDFEVAPAVAAAPIAEQLIAAEPPKPAPMSSGPSAPRGMGARGIAGRGRGFGGKSNAPPLDLLSIGMVDDSAFTVEPTPVRVESSVAAVAAPAEKSAPAGRKGTAKKAVAKPAVKAPTKPAAKSAAKKTATKSGRKRTV
jgi:uncharacterized protein (TIGR00288 family)